MRHSFVLTFVALAGLGGPMLVGQTDEINPRLLLQQIRAQQTLIATPEGKANGEAWLKLGVLLQDNAQFVDSEAAYQQALRLLKPRGEAVVADVLDHMGTMYFESGQLDKAEPLEREALQTREAENDAVGSGVSHTHLAALLLRKGQTSDAEGEAKVAVDLLAPELSGGSPRASVSPEQKMTALINLSLIACGRGACHAAIPTLRSALAIAQKNYSDDSLPVGYVEFLLGYASWRDGDVPAAARFMKSGTQGLAAAVGWGHPLYLRTLTQYATFLHEAGSKAEAARVATEIQRVQASSVIAHADAGPKAN